MEAIKFDVFVIGAGSAGQAVAQNCAKAGLKVGITERKLYGGTCPLRGCDPKKALLSATEVIEMAKNMQGNGVLKQPTISWKAMQKFKNKFTKEVPKASENGLIAAGITTYKEEASFINENTLALGSTVIEAKHIVIATGYKPRPLPVEGALYLKNSEDFLSLKKLPKHIVFIGAGYIGMEFAHIAARAGAKVTVVQKDESPLTGFDTDLVHKLTEYSKKIGINFYFNAEVTEIKKRKKKYNIYFNQDNKELHIKANLVINAAGRVPAIDHLNLEKANIAFSEKGIVVNDYLQSSSNALVYACGDVSEHGLPLTSMTGPEANTVSENIIYGNKVKINTPTIPSVVFTLPNIASVGLLEEEAKKRYKNIIVHYDSAENWFSAKRINAPVYAFKVIVNERTKVIVGAHLIAPHAGETINLFAMAIRNKMNTDDIKNIVFTYPSWSYDLNSMM